MPAVHGDYNINDAYIDMQQIFAAGLVTVIGSGASCALGLPGMHQLGRHLRSTITPQVTAMPGSTRQSWDLVLASLDAGAGLEESLDAAEGDHELVQLIVAETARCVGDAEATAIQEILSSSQPMALSLLLAHTAKTNPIAEVITPNYDRLIELAANRARLGVDSMFYGQPFGRLDEVRSRHEMLRPPESTAKRTGLRLERHPHVRLSKPHGSLDWYFIDGECVRSVWPLTSERRIVVPGSNKYQTGYHMPFDVHRARATTALDRAKSLLFYGYGFNDDHLQTHLRPSTQVPTLIMAHGLSQGALDYIRENPRALGLEAAVVEGQPGTRLVTGSHQIDIPHAELWDLAVFNKEVLGL